jgi:hypothetical protein
MTYDIDGAPIELPVAGADVVEEIFHELWFEMGARLGDYEFYSRHIGRLQAEFGDAAVAAALRLHHAQMRRAVSSQIRQQQAYAARLKREHSAEGLQP